MAFRHGLMLFLIILFSFFAAASATLWAHWRVRPRFYRASVSGRVTCPP